MRVQNHVFLQFDVRNDAYIICAAAPFCSVDIKCLSVFCLRSVVLFACLHAARSTRTPLIVSGVITECGNIPKSRSNKLDDDTGC